MILEDGSGGGYLAKVDSDNRLEVLSIGRTELAEVIKNGDAYVWDYSGYDYDAADTVMFIRNDDNTKNLVLTHVVLYCDTATKVQVHNPDNPTAAGTAVTGSNLNLTSSHTAVATAIQDETGNTQGTVLFSRYVAANGTIDVLEPEEEVVVLGYHQCLGVDLVTAGTMAYGQIIGFYRDK